MPQVAFGGFEDAQTPFVADYLHPRLDVDARRRLSAPGMRTFLAIADLWRLTEEERRLVLGYPSRSTYHNWAKLAREGGAELSDIVEITSYHVGISAHMEAFMRVWARYLKEPYPAWTAIGVAELIVPGGLVELRAVAVDPRQAR